MLSYEDIVELANHRTVLDTYDRFLALRDPEYPDMNYIGLNFKDGEICSLKFYFAIQKRINEEQVKGFLPHTKDFMHYYSLWEPSKVQTAEHTGCSFTVKFKGNKSPERGFHYRLKPTAEAYEMIGEPKTLPFHGTELGTRPGINYEYDARGSSTRRRYYYLMKQDHKDYIAKRFGKPFARESRFCELTEFDDGCKVIIWNPYYTQHNLNRPNYFDAGARNVINRLYQDFGLINVTEGFYENEDIISTYFFNTIGPKTGNVNEGDVNFHMDTLKLFLNE